MASHPIHPPPLDPPLEMVTTSLTMKMTVNTAKRLKERGTQINQNSITRRPLKPQNQFHFKQHNDVYENWVEINIHQIYYSSFYIGAPVFVYEQQDMQSLKKNNIYLSTAVSRHIKYLSCDIKFWRLPQRCQW